MHPQTALVSSANTHTRSRRLTCALLLIITIPVGLAWRFAPLHLPQFAYKYGGSALWAIGVYWLVAILLPRRRPGFLAIAAAAISIAVETFKLFRNPPVDGFRETLAGKILIGKYFTFGAIIAYLLAIALVTLLDERFRFGRSR